MKKKKIENKKYSMILEQKRDTERKRQHRKKERINTHIINIR